MVAEILQAGPELTDKRRIVRFSERQFVLRPGGAHMRGGGAIADNGRLSPLGWPKSALQATSDTAGRPRACF